MAGVDIRHLYVFNVVDVQKYATVRIHTFFGMNDSLWIRRRGGKGGKKIQSTFSTQQEH